MDRDEEMYRMALAQVSGIGLIHKKWMLESLGSAKRVFLDIHSLRSSPAFKKKVVNKILQFKDWKMIEENFKWIDQHQIKLILLGSTDYPNCLKECIDAPILLYARGEIPPAHRFGLGIVGTRTPSEYGKITTSQIIEFCKGVELSIVSGLALGVDQLAHQQALHYNIPTIAILAHGFQYLYPAQNKKLSHDILERGGALITEYPPNINIEKYHFAARNRIIAGWCKVIVVVESGEKGGSLRTANFAMQYNRDVLAVPGRWVDPKSSGVNQLIFNHQAEILIHPSSIKEYIPSVKQGIISSIQETERFSDQEWSILELIQQHGIMHLDELLFHLKWSIADVSFHLFQLEMKGKVQSLPGKYFRIASLNLS